MRSTSYRSAACGFPNRVTRTCDGTPIAREHEVGVLSLTGRDHLAHQAVEDTNGVDVPAHIWVDADACPNVIKEILYRAAARTGVCVTLVANQPLQIPRLPSVRAVQVAPGFDVADKEILKLVAAGDLVITADIPLAAEVIAKGGHALNPRGERYSPDTIRGVLAMRDFMDTMRSSVNIGGGPPPLTPANRNAFAAHLDTWLAHAAPR